VMDEAVSAAVKAHAAEETSAAAFLAASRAHAETVAARARRDELLNAVNAREHGAFEAALAAEAKAVGGAGGAGGGAAGDVLPPKRFDAGVLAQIAKAGALLPASQLPTAVAAVYASLAAAPAAEEELVRALEAARARRAEAESERDAVLAEVAPLRALVPQSSAEELLTQIRNERGRRAQLDAELTVVKGRLSEISDRVGRLQQARYRQGPALTPAEMRWRAKGQNYVRPAELPGVVADVGRAAAEISRYLSAPPQADEHEEEAGA
jgi:hypothetical protein